MPCHRRFIKSRTSPLWPELLLCNTLSSRQIRKPITDSSRRLSVRTPERSGCPSEPQSIFEHEDVATRLAGQGRGASRAHREARTRGARFLASCSVPCSSALRIAAAVRGRLITVLRASTYTTRERQDISGGRVPGEPRRPRPAGLVAAAADPSNESALRQARRVRCLRHGVVLGRAPRPAVGHPRRARRLAVGRSPADTQ